MASLKEFAQILDELEDLRSSVLFLTEAHANAVAVNPMAIPGANEGIVQFGLCLSDRFQEIKKSLQKAQRDAIDFQSI